MRKIKIYAAITFLSLGASHNSWAGEVTGFESSNICKISRDGVSRVDPDKLAVHRAKTNKWGVKDPTKAPLKDWKQLVQRETSFTSFLNFHDKSIFRLDPAPGCQKKENFGGSDFFSGCVHIICLKRTSASSGTVGNASNGSPEPPQQVKKTFSLRGKPEDLGKPLKAPTASSASFSGSNNFEDDIWKAEAKLAAGIVFNGFLTNKGTSESPLLFNPFSFIPFVTYERRFTSRVGDEVNKLGFGAHFDVHFRNVERGGIGHTVAFETQYLTDDVGNSSILDGEVIYYPSLPLPYFRFLQPIGPKQHIVMFVEPSGRFEYGHVFDAGGNAELFRTKDYSRVGGAVELVLTGNPANEENILDKIKLSVAYKWLKTLAGPLDDFQRFSSKVEYKFGQKKNFGVELEYAKGRAETTLQDENFIKGAFTMKLGDPAR